MTLTPTRARVRGVVGESAARPDGVPKVKGEFLFGSDLWRDGMLFGHTLRSPHARALIRGIDARVPGVRAVLMQGGFCTPGRVIATYALLRENPEPTELEVREALSGNICRCTGYGKILEAVQRAAREMYRG